MTAVLIIRREEKEVAAGQTLAAALRGLGLHPELFLAVREGSMIVMETILQPGDRVRLVPVVSGGGMVRKSDRFSLDN